MPAPNPQHPSGLVEYLVNSAKSSEQRTTHIENDNHYGPWIDPVLVNGYAEVAAPQRTVQYRWNYKAGKLDFRGHLSTDIAVSPSIAFYIDPAINLEHDYSFITDIRTGSSTYQTARVYINSSGGAVTIRWPLT